MSDFNTPLDRNSSTSLNANLPLIQPTSALRGGGGGGKIPIYRRSYGVGQVKPRPLVWEDGRLRQIQPEQSESPANPIQSSSTEPFLGAAASRGVFSPSNSATMITSVPRFSSFKGDKMGMKATSGIGGRSRGKGRGATSGIMSPTGSMISSRPSRKYEGQSGTFKIPEMDASLPETKRHSILPMDASTPPFSLSSEEPLPPNNVLFPNLESEQTSAASNIPPSLKMKSGGDGVDDLDFEKLKSYRRLNGYTLFTVAMRKKYSINNDDDGKQDQKSLNRKWQALWATLPERDRQQWKLRAKRMVKAMEAAPEKTAAAEAKRATELKRAEAQLARTETTKYNLIDIAAHFQILSNSFASAAQQLSQYRGPVLMDDVNSTLLDGLLSCLIPLTAIAGQLEPLNGMPDKDTVCKGLTSLAHICPNL
nr:26S proteasome non ATPase regulatory subunit [Hymenolepis microstoma]